MAAIVHRCACEHLDAVHAATGTSDDRRCLIAGCGCADSRPGAPEIIPTWSTNGVPTAQALPSPEIVPPGTVDGPGLGRCCDCEDCQSLYRAETAPAGVSA